MKKVIVFWALLAAALCLGGCTQIPEEPEVHKEYRIYKDLNHSSSSIVALVYGNKLIQGRYRNGRVLANLSHGRLLAGNDRKGKELARIEDNVLIRGGEVIGATDGRHIILGEDIYGNYVGMVRKPDTLAAVMGAAYFRLFSDRTYPQRRLTFICNTDKADIQVYSRSMTPAVEGNFLYRNFLNDQPPIMNVSGNKIIDGGHPLGKVLGTFADGVMTTADGDFCAEYTDKAIYRWPRQYNEEPLRYIDGDNELAGPLGAMRYYLSEIAGGGGGEGGEGGEGGGGEGGEGGGDDAPVYRIYTPGVSSVIVQNNCLYGSSGGPVLARLKGRSVYSGASGIHSVATYSSSYLFAGSSTTGDPIAYFWLNTAYRGSSPGGSVICSTSGGGDGVLALAAAYCLGLCK